MTLSPGSIMLKSAIAWPTGRCRRLDSLAISTGGLMRIEPASATAESGERTRFLQCVVHTENDAESVSTALVARIGAAIDSAGGWLPFSAFMAHGALRAGARLLRERPDRRRPHARGGSDFVTAPELSPLFGRALARQVEEALDASGSDEVWEFGAGSGRAGGRAARRARPAHPPLLDRRAVGAAARAPARRDPGARRRRRAGSTRCPSG